MIEVPTDGKKALLDAIIEHVDPATYDGGHGALCLCGQTRRGLAEQLPTEHSDLYGHDVILLSEIFGVREDTVWQIYDGVCADELRDDYEKSIAFAREVLLGGNDGDQT